MKNSIKQSKQNRNVPLTKRLLLGIALCLFTLNARADGVAPTPGVLPPNSAPYGKSYGQWSEAFFQWAFSLPVTAHPLFDTADCSAGQSGNVWFIAGNFTGTPVVRNCTIPVGKALFFP